MNYLLKLLVFGDSDLLSDVEEGQVGGESSQATQEAATEQLSSSYWKYT